jgi:segregation and condensation protein A
MAYQVKLEVYEGPFDLLLTLIARRKLDVTEVDLAEITADFLAHLGEGLEELDLETATRFLVVAATLVELKAARLLPREDREELEDLLGEARDLLYARLLEYRAFRDVSRIFAHRLLQHETILPRELPPEPWLQRLLPDTPLQVDAAGLAALAAAATAPTPEAAVDLSHIRKSYVTIREAALEVLARLGEPGRAARFGELTAGRARGDRVVFFLALLELFKLGHVELEQPDHRGPMSVARRDGGKDLGSLTDEDDEPDDATEPTDAAAPTEAVGGDAGAGTRPDAASPAAATLAATATGDERP